MKPDARQIELPFGDIPPPEMDLLNDPPTRVDERSASSLASLLERAIGTPVHVVLTSDAGTLVSSRRIGSRLIIRLDRVFLGASDDIVRAIAAYVTGREQGSQEVLAAFIDGTLSSAQDAQRHSEREAVGESFDLDEILDRLNTTYFGGRFQGSICWGKRAPARTRYSIRLGSYDYGERLVRIHPSLDRPFVPMYYLESIVFHEMLHQLVPDVVRNGQRSYHNARFKAAERSFPEYRRARRWQKENLRRLLRG